MGAVLSSSKKQVLETAKSQLLQAQMEGVRKAMLAHVAEKYTEEAEHNFSQYIRALGEANIEMEYKGKPGEALVIRAQNAIKELEGYLEAQNPDGAVIQFLKKRYKEEGIRIITGRLYGAHLVNRKSQGVYEVLNTMGYAANVNKKKPWLTGAKTTQGLETMFADAALEIFNVMFDDVDLSSEAATLSFTGVGDQFAEDSTQINKFGNKTNPSKKKSTKRKRR
jgi:hypothetical protein